MRRCMYICKENVYLIYIYTHIYLRYTFVEPGGVILPMPLKEELAKLPAVYGGILSLQEALLS